MKHPVNHRKIFSLTLIIILASILASAASLLGAGLRWAAARPHPPSNLAANLATNLAANLAAKAVAQGCSLNCAATVPATGEVGAAVAFTATATPSGCATAPTY
jgi:hypothetical protein